MGWKNLVIFLKCKPFKAQFKFCHFCKNNNPQVICLQEAHLKQSENASMHNYTLYGRACAEQDPAKGGTAVFVQEGVIHSEVPFDTS